LTWKRAVLPGVPSTAWTVEPLASDRAPVCSVWPELPCSVPPSATVTAATIVPRPASVPPLPTPTALLARTPSTCRVPADTVVAPP